MICSYKKISKRNVTRKSKDAVHKDNSTVLLSRILEEQSNAPEESQADTLQENELLVEDNSESYSNMHTDNDRVSDRNDSAFDGHEDDSS